jgi:hypothetical protein
MKPTSKVGTAGIAGAATTVLVFLSAALGSPVPPEVAASLVTLIMFGAAYLTTDA